jgi:hypothetical protein
MNRVQKIAWIFVSTTLLAIVVCITTIIILYFMVGMPKALYGFGTIGLAGLGGVGPSIFKKDKSKVAFDERDKLIEEKAKLTGFTAEHVFAGLACMVPFFALGPKGLISVTWLPMIFIGAFLSYYFVHSVSILVQYGGMKEKNHE